MKKKGFTLVELLAVIVILAIIALIAVPMVLNIIEKSKIGALKSSLNGLIESADMYYANNQLQGGNAVETIFDFEDGEQTSGTTLEYKGKIENGKLILHTNGEVAACIDDGEHYAYKNKTDNKVTTGLGTCLYDGTTGDFSSNSLITDLRGQVVEATTVTKDDNYTYINIPEEGHYDKTSQIKVDNINLVKVYKDIIFLGTTGKKVTCDISSFYSNYKNITIDNIFVEIDFTRMRGHAINTDSLTTIKKSYDPTTGILTLETECNPDIIYYFSYANETKGTIIII